MRVFLFISKDGDGWSLARRVKDEGHRAVVYINDPSYRQVGEGIVEKSKERGVLVRDGEIDNSVLMEVLHPKPDCIVFDAVDRGYGKLVDQLRAMGYPVIGGSALGTQLEIDESYENRVLVLMGIPTRPIEGIEIDTELWFNGKEVLHVTHALKEKELMDGGVGPKAGSMGVVTFLGSKETRLFKEGLGKVVPALRKAGYHGPVNLTTIISESELYAYGLSARLSYDGVFLIREYLKGRINDLLYGFATGVIKRVECKGGWNIGVTIALEPFPMSIAAAYSKDTLLDGCNKQNLKHIWFIDAYLDSDVYACAGTSGKVGVVTAHGDTVREARRRVYRTIANLDIRDVMYRRDIGERVMSDYNQLKKWGWL